jgi:hypothetical protein
MRFSRGAYLGRSCLWRELHLDLCPCRKGPACLFAGVDGQIVLGLKPAIGGDCWTTFPVSRGGPRAPLLGDLGAGLSRGRFESGADRTRVIAPVIGLVAIALRVCGALRPRIGLDRDRPEFVNPDHTQGGRRSYRPCQTGGIELARTRRADGIIEAGPRHVLGAGERRVTPHCGHGLCAPGARPAALPRAGGGITRYGSTWLNRAKVVGGHP